MEGFGENIVATILMDVSSRPEMPRFDEHYPFVYLIFGKSVSSHELPFFFLAA